MSNDDFADLKAAMRRKTPKSGDAPQGPFLSTGSTLLNLGLSDRVFGGLLAGHFYWLVGDSTSGKTFLSLTCFAEAMLNEAFKNYRLIYDNGEDGALMSIRKFFGPKVAKRIEPPRGTRENPIYSEMAEDFYANVTRANRDGRPYIYVQDSENSLDSEASTDKFEKDMSLREKGKDTTGSYGDGKAKIHSSNLRKLIKPLSKTGSILIVISQTRDNIGFGAQFNPKTVSGGRALKFYATQEMWSSVAGHIQKTVNGKKRDLGINVQVRIKKNRVTGKARTVEIPIYWSYGFDDLGSCVNYLVDEGHWACTGGTKGVIASGTIDAPEFGFKGKAEKLIAHIEENNQETELRRLVGRVWKGIEAQCVIQRKPRYV